VILLKTDIFVNFENATLYSSDDFSPINGGDGQRPEGAEEK